MFSSGSIKDFFWCSPTKQLTSKAPSPGLLLALLRHHPVRYARRYLVHRGSCFGFGFRLFLLQKEKPQGGPQVLVYLAVGQKYRVPKKTYWLKEKNTKTCGLFFSIFPFTNRVVRVYRLLFAWKKGAFDGSQGRHWDEKMRIFSFSSIFPKFMRCSSWGPFDEHPLTFWKSLES